MRMNSVGSDRCKLCAPLTEDDAMLIAWSHVGANLDHDLSDEDELLKQRDLEVGDVGDGDMLLWAYRQVQDRICAEIVQIQSKLKDEKCES